MADDALTVVTQAYDLFGKGDIPGLLSLIDDDADWTSKGLVEDAEAKALFGTWKGPDGAAKYFDQLTRGITRSAAEADQVAPTFAVEGDTVTVKGHTTGVFTSSGKPIDNDWIHVLTVRDGKITSYKEEVQRAVVAV